MAASKSFFLLFSLLYCGRWIVAEVSSLDHPVEKRSVGLTYPAPPTLLLIFGLGTPLQLEREATIVGAFAKFIYNLPIDASNYTRPFDQQPKTRSRWALYRALGQLLELRGLPEGRACVLRSICEAAHGPFARAAGGLLQPLLQTLLTPSSTINEPYDVHEDRDYVEAEALGRGQFVVAASTPIAQDKKGSLVLNTGFQFNYAMPWNLTQLGHPTPVVHARNSRQVQRQPERLNLENVYLALENALEE
ncbi:uncharacterized protein LOC106653589 [Trichogramma pretiosum]|uniref:uncharacterized protein LOC106653589 n=1 Tax=Trichogramma pretiosum TaxID=7493 RepID=UPI0006C9A714|nr:uncharacterized protein LOC106653589 [Trichogramma pretiosum]